MNNNKVIMDEGQVFDACALIETVKDRCTDHLDFEDLNKACKLLNDALNNSEKL